MEIKEVDFSAIKDLVWELEYQTARNNFEKAEHIAKQLRNILALIEFDFKSKGEK